MIRTVGQSVLYQPVCLCSTGIRTRCYLCALGSLLVGIRVQKQVMKVGSHRGDAKRSRGPDGDTRRHASWTAHDPLQSVFLPRPSQNATSTEK